MSEAARSFCSQLSQQADEALFATATPTGVYLLLEYREAWAAKAVEASAIPEAVKAHLNSFAKSLPAAKLLLIKGRAGAQESPLHFFIASISQQALYKFTLERYEDVLALDLAAILAGAPEYQKYRQQESLYFVCTNGRRDACCSRYGLPVYEALRQAAQDNVWQVSHVGGHRFAANVLVLPQGLLYGRLQPQDIPALLEAHQQGKLLLERLRGNTAYSPAAQAAEYFLRQQTGEIGIDAFRLVDEQGAGEAQWQVQFTQDSSRTHNLCVSLEKSEGTVFESCTLDKATALNCYHLRSYEVHGL